ncbi:MAG: helix-turn-helix transcriptional regulator [Sphingobacteriales bacterium]|nr:helix-turn-helix transcriptional regulator [Sphingobacteriales bacterium]
MLLCLAQGNSYKDIANKLGIKFNTVKNHLKHIYKKTGVSSMIQATAWYYTK